MCSTPNGIKGTYTLTVSWEPRRTASAQRLTASKEPTQGVRVKHFVQHESCSTPNGIKGTYTIGGLQDDRAHRVLNA